MQKVRQLNFTPGINQGHQTCSYIYVYMTRISKWCIIKKKQLVYGKCYRINIQSPDHIGKIREIYRARICKTLRSPKIDIARLHRLAESIPWNRFLGSLNVYNSGSGHEQHIVQYKPVEISVIVVSFTRHQKPLHLYLSQNDYAGRHFNHNKYL